jgi:hypothetical protein
VEVQGEYNEGIWEYNGSTEGVQWRYREYSGGIGSTVKVHGTTVGVQGEYSENTGKYSGSAVKIQGSTVGVQWSTVKVRTPGVPLFPLESNLHRGL